MTQKGWWLALTPILLALFAGPSWADGDQAKQSCIEVEAQLCCPHILSKLPIVGPLFKHAAPPCSSAHKQCTVPKSSDDFQDFLFYVGETPTGTIQFSPTAVAVPAGCTCGHVKKPAAKGCAEGCSCEVGKCSCAKTSKTAAKCCCETGCSVGACCCKKASTVVTNCCCEPGKCKCPKCACASKDCACVKCGCAKTKKVTTGCPCSAGKKSPAGCFGKKRKKSAVKFKGGRFYPLIGYAPDCSMPAMIPFPPPPVPHPGLGPIPLSLPLSPPGVGMVGGFPFMPPCLPAPPVEEKQYVVELKMSVPGAGKCGLVALPRVTVSAGQPFMMACDDSGKQVCALVGESCPLKAGGNGVCVTVTPLKGEIVMLDVALHHCRHGKEENKGFVERMNSIHFVKPVKLGEMTKVPCGHVAKDGKTGCWIELTVKELPQVKAAQSCPVPCPMLSFTQPCPPPCAFTPPIERVEYRTMATPKPITSNVLAPPAARFGRPSRTPGSSASSRLRSGKASGLSVKVSELGKLEVCGGEEACALCEETVLKAPGCLPVRVHVLDRRIALAGEHFILEGMADRVSVAPGGFLVLEGNVRVRLGTSDSVEVEGGKVRVKLPQQPEFIKTGVISNPCLMPDR